MENKTSYVTTTAEVTKYISGVMIKWEEAILESLAKQNDKAPKDSSCD